MAVIDFSNYIPVADGRSGDCAKAVISALEDIRAGGEDCVLSFPKGEYHIYKDFCPVREWHTSNTDSTKYPKKTIGFLIENQKNLTVEGNGSEFVFHGDMMAFCIAKSENIVLKNFSWDFAEPTTTQMNIESVNKNTVSYRIPDGCPFEIAGKKIKWICGTSPYTDKPYYTQFNAHECWCTVGFNPQTNIKRRYSFLSTPFTRAKKIVRTGTDTVDIKYRFSIPKPWNTVGMSCEMCASKHRPTAGAFFWESKNISVQNVNVRYLHGFGWLTQMCENVEVLGCNFEPDSDRLCTSYADLIHVSGAAGKIKIENCHFSHAHDDPINIHGTFTRVENKKDSHTLVLKYVHSQQGGFPQFHIGDEVMFYARDTLSPLENREEVFTVTAVTNPFESGLDGKTSVVSFDKALPDSILDKIGKEPKYVAENITYTPSVEIRGCDFNIIPTRGILCTTRKPVIIENNRFDNIAMACIFISNDSSDWYESGPVRDMVIRNNEFNIRETGQTEWKDAPAVYVHPVTKGGKTPDEPVHKNITIENNTVHLFHDRAFLIESVENLIVRNNKVIREGNQSGEIIQTVKCKNVSSDI